MQIQNISNNNSFKALYIDKNLDLEHRQQLFKFKRRLNKIADNCDLYIKKVAVPVQKGDDYIISKSFLCWEIAPLGSKETNKKSLLNILKFSKKEKSPKMLLGHSEIYNMKDLRRMISLASRNAFNIDYVMEQGKIID